MYENTAVSHKHPVLYFRRKRLLHFHENACMGAILNRPVAAPELLDLCQGGLFSTEAGDAEMDFFTDGACA